MYTYSTVRFRIGRVKTPSAWTYTSPHYSILQVGYTMKIRFLHILFHPFKLFNKIFFEIQLLFLFMCIIGLLRVMTSLK